MTDGEANNPGSSVPLDELAARRRVQTAAALDRLGVRARVTHLQLPDGGADDLERPVLRDLSLRPGEWSLAPWSRDGHPDHEAVGRACATAAARDGARLLAKAAAVAEFVMQVASLGPLREDAPVLPPYVLARFARSSEVVFA